MGWFFFSFLKKKARTCLYHSKGTSKKKKAVKLLSAAAFSTTIWKPRGLEIWGGVVKETSQCVY